MANKEKNLKPAKSMENQSYRRRIGKAPKSAASALDAIVDKKLERDLNWLDQFLPKGRKMRQVRANVTHALPHVAAAMLPRRVAMHPAIAAPYVRAPGLLVVLGRDLYPPTIKPRSKRGWPNGGKELRKIEATKAENARKTAKEEQRKANMQKHYEWAEQCAANMPAEERLAFLSEAGLSPSHVTMVLEKLGEVTA